MTATDVPWREHARRLTRQLADDGVLHDPAWRSALEDTPRHVFVPRFYVQRENGTWDEAVCESATALDACYRNEPLITSLAHTADGQWVTVSSSTKPSLMVRMLEALDLEYGHRVLEIGTGTGYNAALLTHRLRGDQVFSVDIGPDLVDKARARLAELGYTPTLVATDGSTGLPEHAPYDRIIATCSVPGVPPTWMEQLKVGGRVLVDLKCSTHAGNLVLLRKAAGRLEGRFLPNWAGFMSIRSADTAPDDSATPAIHDVASAVRSTTFLDPRPWSALVPWFLAHAELPRGVSVGYRDLDGNRPRWLTLSAPDGSWCAVAMQSYGDGVREVRQAGSIGVWDAFERAYRVWDGLERPGWDRLGLTVERDGTHRVWLDDPGQPIALV